MRKLIDFNCFRCRLIITTVGFMTHSEDLRPLGDDRSCFGDYDPTRGEPFRMAKLLKGHQITEAESGTKIINSSSFITCSRNKLCKTTRARRPAKMFHYRRWKVSRPVWCCESDASTRSREDYTKSEKTFSPRCVNNFRQRKASSRNDDGTRREKHPTIARSERTIES